MKRPGLDPTALPFLRRMHWSYDPLRVAEQVERALAGPEGTDVAMSEEEAEGYAGPPPTAEDLPTPTR